MAGANFALAFRQQFPEIVDGRIQPLRARHLRFPAKLFFASVISGWRRFGKASLPISRPPQSTNPASSFTGLMSRRFAIRTRNLETLISSD